MRHKVAIVGGGAWGSALAVHLARHGHPVSLWLRDPALVQAIRERHENAVYLPGIEIPTGVTPTVSMEQALSGAAMVVAAVPSPFARAVYASMLPLLDADVPLLLAIKGIEEGSHALPAEVAADVLGPRPLAVLCGPSFASEVAGGAPTVLVVAGRDDEINRRVQEEMASPAMRLYTQHDLVGVQLAAAIKNVIAIAAGIVDGLGLGKNSAAAVITRGLAEMARFGVRRGGAAPTFSGLAGLGDLVLTCTGAESRNRTVGRALGLGRRLDEVLAGMRSVAEGVRTTRSVYEMAGQSGVEMPIVEATYGVLFEGRAPRGAVERLMTRPLTAEQPEWGSAT